MDTQTFATRLNQANSLRPQESAILRQPEPQPEPKRAPKTALQEVIETVVNVEQYDDGYPPDDLLGFLAWVLAVTSSIPEEYRLSATIEVQTPVYDDHYTKIKVSYRRPETAEDVALRQEREKDRRERQERADLEQLRRLQDKYGVTP